MLGGGPGDGRVDEPLEEVGDDGMVAICAGSPVTRGRGAFERREMGDQSLYGVGVGDGVSRDDDGSGGKA